MHSALQKIEQLLRQYGHVYEANMAMLAAERWRQDPVRACGLLCAEEWWRQNDSIAAIELALSGGFSAVSRAHSQQFRQALITVYTTLKAYDRQDTQAELLVTQFAKWNESHI